MHGYTSRCSKYQTRSYSIKACLETPFDDATREMKVRLYEYMTSIFQYQAEILMNDKKVDPKRRLEIQSIYVTSKEKAYKKEIKDYLQQMRQIFSDAALAHTHRTSLNYGNWLSFDNAKPSWEVKYGGGKFPLEEKGSKLVSPEAIIKDLDAEEDSNDLNSHKLPERLRAIEDTKVTPKKRKGIVIFIRIFPRFVEHSTKSADLLKIRRTVNRGYERIVKTVFEKNTHHFYSEIRTRKIMALEQFMRSARSSYYKHLEAYSKSVVRKPFGKLL
ncbi:11632_t:CDS:2, partial [Diversispora eburnea]